ncbi:MAG: ABC transporter ATP-binding protein, partial [Mariprofundales bacterium]|nr:ABC transporter ATP-binding protein [Mariprofundales bacterium]
FATPQGMLSVLHNLSCSVDAGEFVAIVGESGSGKSTLLQILGTLERPDSGQVLLDDTQLFAMSAGEHARFRNERLGFVYQAHHLIPELTALENVALPLQIRGSDSGSVIHQRAVAILADLGLADRLHHVPGRLSGGEAQRVAVARALIGKPTLLLADEPTGNLDESAAEAVFALLLEMCRKRGTAVVMVTHSHALASAADRRLLLQHGSIVSS